MDISPKPHLDLPRKHLVKMLLVVDELTRRLTCPTSPCRMCSDGPACSEARRRHKRPDQQDCASSSRLHPARDPLDQPLNDGIERVWSCRASFATFPQQSTPRKWDLRRMPARSEPVLDRGHRTKLPLDRASGDGHQGLDMSVFLTPHQALVHPRAAAATRGARW